jgi:hypothetical protein
MVDQLNTFASEVTRVAREVGTEGKLGGQAQVKGVSGIWEDLTTNVNTMAANLTNQVQTLFLCFLRSPSTVPHHLTIAVVYAHRCEPLPRWREP